MKKILIFIGILFYFTPLLEAQDKNFLKGDKYYNAKEYKEAINYLLKVEVKNFNIDLKLAYSYSRLHNPSNSVYYYEKARSKKWPFNYDFMLDYGNVLRQLEQYNKAKEVYKEMSTIPLEMIKSCDWVQKSKVKKPSVKLDSLSLGSYTINGYFKLRDSILYPYEKDGINYKFTWYNIKDTSYSDLIKYDWEYNLNSPNLIGDSILIYSANSSKQKYKSRRAIRKGLVSENHENKLTIWSLNIKEKNSEAKRLSFTNANYGYSHPFYDSRNSRLFFVSDMPGGYGGFDIYYVDRTEDGWTEPKNLGYEVNTTYDEAFPYVKDDILFFSSKGHIGYGGYDIFMISYKKNKFQAVNMGKPFNSSKDDFAYKEDSINKGYFVSNRQNTLGKDYLWTFTRNISKKSIENTEIELVHDSLKVNNNKGVNPFTICNKYLMGEIQELNNKGGVQILGIWIPEENERIESTILKIPENGSFENSKDHMLEYAKPLDSLKFDFIYHRDSCVVEIIELKTKASIKVLVDDNGVEDIRNVYCINKVNTHYSYNYLYFDFNSFSLIYNCKKELDKLISLLQKYKNIRLKLVGYADERGSEGYNKILSKKRAKMVRDYLISNGISSDRIEYTGGGEYKVKNQTKEEYSRARSVIIEFHI